VDRSLTVLIPSIGRTSIKSAIEGILVSNNNQIIILAHGKEAYAKLLSWNRLSRVKVLECEESLSISDLCNIGLKHVSSEFFTFFSDDDIWSLGKSEALIETLNDNPKADIAVGRTEEIQQLKKRIRPNVLICPNEPVLEYLYGQPVFLSNKKYLALQDAVMRKGRYPQFRSGLNVYEDILWLADSQKMGRQIHGINKIVSAKYPSLKRSNDRQNPHSVKNMYTEIRQFNENVAKSYFRYHAIRACVGIGDIRMFLSILRVRANTGVIGIIDFVVVPIQLTIIMIVKFKNFLS
jgi:hypothetical protein